MPHLKPASESTPKLDAKTADGKAADAAERKDTTSSKILSTSSKQGTISSKQETITTNDNATSAKNDTVPTQNGAASGQSVNSASQKVTKSGPVEVVNTFDDDDEDVVDVKTSPKPSMKNEKPKIKDKNQSIEEIMDDLGNALVALYITIQLI